MRRARDQRGVAAVEYALIVALVAAVSLLSITLLSKVMTAEYTDTCTQVARSDGDAC